MTTGRKKNPGTEPLTIDMNQAAVKAAGTALAVQGAELLAMQQKLGLEDISPTTLVRETKLWIDHSARAMYEVGIRLVALRVQCPKGEWTSLLEQQIGMAPRTAQRFMAASLKCVGQEGRRDQLLKLDRSKVMELVSLDDDKLDELERTGRIGQLSLELDEIDSMSQTQLRARLREAEQQVAAKQKLIANRDAKISRLEEQIERPFAADEEAANAEERAALDALRDCVMAAEAELLKLAHMLPMFTRGSLSESASVAGQQAAQYLAQRLAEALQGAGVAVDFEEMVVPGWIKKAQQKKRAA